MTNSVGTQTDFFTNAFLNDELKDSDRTFSSFFSSQRVKPILLVECLPLNADSVRYVGIVDDSRYERDQTQKVVITGSKGRGELLTWHRPTESMWRKQGAERNVHVEIVLGPDGCGKTLYATGKASHFRGGCYIIYHQDLRRGLLLENYRGEKNLILEGFYDGCMNIIMLLALMSEDKVTIQTNFGFHGVEAIDAKWEQVFITSVQETFCSGESAANKVNIEQSVSRWYDCHTSLGLSRLRSQLRMIVGGENMPELTDQQRMGMQNADTDSDEDF